MGLSIHVRAASETARAGAQGEMGHFMHFIGKRRHFFSNPCHSSPAGKQDASILAKGILPRLQRPQPRRGPAATIGVVKLSRRRGGAILSNVNVPVTAC